MCREREREVKSDPCMFSNNRREIRYSFVSPPPISIIIINPSVNAPLQYWLVVKYSLLIFQFSYLSTQDLLSCLLPSTHFNALYFLSDPRTQCLPCTLDEASPSRCFQIITRDILISRGRKGYQFFTHPCVGGYTCTVALLKHLWSVIVSASS